MTRTGTILKLDEQYAVVMTDISDFIKIRRKPSMVVGKQVEFSKFDIIPAGNRYTANLSRFPLIAGVAVIIAAIAISAFWGYPVPGVYAFIDIDINPSIELGVDKQQKVVNVSALNKDGEVFLSDLKLSKMRITDALSVIVRKSAETGLLSQTGENLILISGSLNPDRTESKGYGQKEEQELDILLDSIKTAIKNTATGKINIEPRVIKVTPQVKELAEKNGLSMGRQAAFMKAQEAGVPLTIKEAKNQSVKELLGEQTSPVEPAPQPSLQPLPKTEPELGIDPAPSVKPPKDLKPPALIESGTVSTPAAD
jgi:hypothetical protein